MRRAAELATLQVLRHMFGAVAAAVLATHGGRMRSARRRPRMGTFLRQLGRSNHARAGCPARPLRGGAQRAAARLFVATRRVATEWPSTRVGTRRPACPSEWQCERCGRALPSGQLGWQRWPVPLAGAHNERDRLAERAFRMLLARLVGCWQRARDPPDRFAGE